MILLLAQATAPDAGTVEPWLKAFFWLAGGVFAVVKLIKEFTPAKAAQVSVSPQPLEVKAHLVAATQEDIDQIHGRIKRERLEIDKALQALKEEDVRLREKLDQELKDINDRIDRVPERTISLLRETKNLIPS